MDCACILVRRLTLYSLHHNWCDARVERSARAWSMLCDHRCATACTRIPRQDSGHEMSVVWENRDSRPGRMQDLTVCNTRLDTHIYLFIVLTADCASDAYPKRTIAPKHHDEGRVLVQCHVARHTDCPSWTLYS